MSALRSIRAKLDKIDALLIKAIWKRRQARPRAYPILETAGIELEFGP
jgi:hypothetical protein